MRGEVDRINKIFSDSKRDVKLKYAVIDRVQHVLKSSQNRPLDAIKRSLERLNAHDRKRTNNTSVVSCTPPHTDDESDESTNKKRANTNTISERGSFRQLIIKQISQRINSELVEVLVIILNHHSSELYHATEDETNISMEETEMNQLTDREKRKYDPKMRRIWLELLKQKKIIVLVSSKLNRLVNTNNEKRNLQIDVETKLTVEFPFSPYINSYFHKIRG
eukprot:248457_1